MTKVWIWLRIGWAALTSRSNQAFYDRIAPIYEKAFVAHRVHAETIAALLSDLYAGKQKETLVLDLGCGTGILSRMLAERGFNVVDVDVSFESLRLLTRRDTRANAVQADAEYLPIATDSLQSVVCLGVWRHFPRPSKVLEEIARVLEQDGALVIGYFPPAIAGAFHLGPKRFNSLLVRLYEFVTNKLGYADRAGFELEGETVDAAIQRFALVREVASGLHWRVIYAQRPKSPKLSS